MKQRQMFKQQINSRRRNQTKRIWSFVALLVIVFPVLAACGGGEKPTATKEEVKPTATKEEVKSTATAEEMAEINIEAKADILRDWGGVANGKSYSEPIGVVLNFTGGVAAKAYRYGQVQITAAKHNKGLLGGDLEIIWIKSSKGVFWAGLSEFQVIDHAKVDVVTEELVQPEDGFRVHIHFFPIEGATQITTLTGMVTLQTIDGDQVITIGNLDSLRSTSKTQLEDLKLDAIGNASVEFGDYVTLVVEGQVLDDLKARIIDAQGNILLPTGRGSSTVDGTETKHVGFSIPDEDLPGTRLEIIPAFKVQVITIENLDSLRSASKTQLKDPRFDAIGNVSVEFDDYVTLVVEGQVLDDLQARIIDAQGNILLPTSRGSSTVGGTETKDFGFSIPDEDLPGARLEIIPFFRAQVITIENLASLRSTSENQLKDPKFDAIGNVSVEFDDYVTLVVKDQALPDDLEARIIDAQGNIWLPLGWGSGKVGRTETKHCEFSIPDEDLPSARLEIIPAFNSLEIPFEFSDITIKQ